MRNRRNTSLLAFTILFFLIYGLISFVNHFNYRTYALDLGQYNNAIYDYAHFRFNYSESLQATEINLLSADHFDLLLIFVSPIYWLFGTYTLLMLQAVALTLGGVGIYFIARRQLNLSEGTGSRIPLLVAIMYWSFFGIYNAVGYDYHGNVVAASLLPWFIWNVINQKKIFAGIFFILIIFCKESMPLWMFFVCTGYAWLYRSSKIIRVFLFALAFISLIYFIALVALIMPSLGGMEKYAHTEYTSFGKSFSEIIANIFRSPFRAIKYLLVEQVPEATTPWLKVEFWVFTLCSGGFLLFVRPVYLWMMISVLATKMYHDRWSVHGIGGQYSIEFAPVIALCAIDFLASQNKNARVRLAMILVIASIGVSIRNFDRTISYTNKRNIRFYKASHYTSDYDRKAVQEAMKLIPADAVISVQNCFHPHLAYRIKAFQFPLHKEDAEFILFSDSVDAYPLLKNELSEIKMQYLTDRSYTQVFNQSSIYLFKQKPGYIH